MLAMRFTLPFRPPSRTILDQSEIAHRRLHVQLRQDLVAARAGRQLGRPALGIVQVAEHDGLRGTRLLACRPDHSVARNLTAPPGPGLALLDALHAEAAFLHDPARPDG